MERQGFELALDAVGIVSYQNTILALPFAQMGPFPRGPGFYYSTFHLALIIVGFFLWVRLCVWVDRDCQRLEMSRDVWNSYHLLAGAIGFFLVWALPYFALSYILLYACIAGAFIPYVLQRNQQVDADEQLLTQQHFRKIVRKYFKFGSGGKKSQEADDGHLPIRFIGRSMGQTEEDPKRVARIEGARGYKGALSMIHDAIVERATDIHLEPNKLAMSVRFRVDGVMRVEEPFSRAVGDSIVNIFKVLSNMDITEKRKPQDGSFSADVDGHTVDFRVATAGSVLGEKMVMRILDRSQQVLSLKKLGMREKMRDQLKRIIAQPHGLLLVCGPTGSGKSTTLYACLNEVDRFQQNIITIENPVEYQLSNVTQIEVNTRAGKTFANELRSILRQDPDIIMIGEIRDQETAEIACQAAQTGHMVYSTVHANDTITAITRLIDLGVSPYLVANSVSAILTQRLVRLLCPACKVRYKPNPDTLRKANLPVDRIKYFFRALEEKPTSENGEEDVCQHCGGTGYFGRTGIFELLVITDRIRDLIRDDPNPTAIKQEAIKSGMRYLYEDGFRQVIEGLTSIQELMRVCK